MATLRERVANFIDGGRRVDAMRQLAGQFIEAYQYSTDPRVLVERLQESDPELLDWLVQQRGWEVIGTLGQQATEEDRLRAVKVARRMYHYDVQSWRAIQMWTDFGFGQQVQVVPRDERAVEVWDEFWAARRNLPLLGPRNIHRLSNTVLVNGELFFTFFASALDDRATATMRSVPTDEISKVVKVEDDAAIPLYYVRNVKNVDWYYPDWRATKAELAKVEIPRGAVLASDTGNLTNVVMLHAAVNESDDGRGWPQLERAHSWFRAYNRFLENRATINAAVAMFVDEIIHKGGSKSTDEIAAKFASALSATNAVETNPTPAAGSMLIHNEALEMRRRPLTTGAGDARMDGMTILGQGAYGAGIPLGWAGRPDAFQNRAVADNVTRPWLEQMERYQSWWTSVFGDMVEIVLRLSGQEFETYEADVTLQSPLDVQQEDVARLLANVTDAVSKGALNAEAGGRMLKRLMALALTDLGVRDAEAVLEPPEEETPPETEEAIGAMIETARANLRGGGVDAETVAEWALAELLEGEGERGQ